ncbi:putative phosphatidylserine decarboxylase proenzyme [Phaeomoniella chlamydospora]|uniref:Phosphatidylserine decarboxylase proenzyme 1, mitochondrial n=1 Tax=Phaeomoniella chlamydospora TaxID=158046 RepID=A0A0G2E3Y8_PHACM|nr:putative phosphatidylserine decarboxylase proenzyme [Phaeomoniella chlamydospora]
MRRRLHKGSSSIQLEAPAYYSPLRTASLTRNTVQRRTFLNSRPCYKAQNSFSARLGKAWRDTPIKWYPIPVGLGIAFLGFRQFSNVRAREQAKIDDAEGDALDGKKPPRRPRIRPSGPWQVQVMSTLPLKALSRLWGRFNELNIPYHLRAPGFKLYGWIFGVNFNEISEPDLHAYPNLAAFFYRTLKPGVRPLDPNPNAILSPADGRVLSFGMIERGEVEQVKGMTYSLDALLGKAAPTTPNPSHPSNIFTKDPQTETKVQSHPSADDLASDEEFAKVNGISYSLPDLFSGQSESKSKAKPTMDASTKSQPRSEAEVRADFALGPTTKPWWDFGFSSATPQKTALYYLVVYLAPGDYHRFHSPISWIVSSRRHFAGELYSVSPYLQRTLPGLFTLNERVVLLGRWRWGFFSFIPVGATNVGSIKINFDKELRTNSLTTDTAADRAAAAAAERGESYAGFSEATYEHASKVLRGHALRRGEEMGGFQLGSSIVLVFEAPRGRRPTFDEGFQGEKVKGGWKWNIEKGQKVKVGQALGWVDSEE